MPGPSSLEVHRESTAGHDSAGPSTVVRGWAIKEMARAVRIDHPVRFGLPSAPARSAQGQEPGGRSARPGDEIEATHEVLDPSHDPTPARTAPMPTDGTPGHPRARRSDLDHARPDARARGLMRNLEALLARSAHGTLRSCIPPVTSAAWTTMMTGCGPARHGVFDHRHFDVAAGRLKVNHARRVRVPTFWHQLSDVGTVGRQPQPPGHLSPPGCPGDHRLGDGRPPPRSRPLRGAPQFAETAPKAEVPGYQPQVRSGSVPRVTSPRWSENSRARPVDLFEAEAEAGMARRPDEPRLVGADGPVPEPGPVPAPGLALPERRRDGDRRPTTSTRPPRAVMAGLDRAIGRLCELAEKPGGRRDARQRPRVRPVPGAGPRQSRS